MNRLFLLALVAGLSLPAASAQTSFINEIHYDNASTDVNEAVEVVVPTGTDVSGYAVVLYNGGDQSQYDSDGLGALVTTAGGKDIYVVSYPSNGIQNGAPDGIALADGATLIQFLCYEGTFTASGGVADGVTCEDIGQSETSSTLGSESLQLGGSGDDYSEFSWQDDATATFGAVNTNQVFSASDIFDGPGWRLLAVPGSGVTVDDLADINLVQGVTGEYPSADDNLFLDYGGGGTGTYGAATATTDAVEAGKGFMWYWFDAAFGPFAGGTSSSQELSAFTLPDEGSELTANVAITRTRNAGDNFYMIGNPFKQPFDVAGITSTNTVLAGSFLAYDPALGMGSTGATSGGYVEVTSGDLIAVWQGVFAEVTTYNDSNDPNFTFAEASRVPVGTPPFFGRADRPTTVALMLNGELDFEGADPVPVVDAVTKARFRAGATMGADRYDLSELAPPNRYSASLAFATERNGEPHRLAIHSMSEDLKGSVTLPLVFSTSASGTFTITGELVSIPEGWTASLRDLETGAIVDLTSGESHTFTTDTPTEWTSRFELVVSASSSVDSETLTVSDEIVGEPAPNPSTGAVRLQLYPKATEHVTAVVYDALGRSVLTAFEGEVSSGTYPVLTFDVSDLAPGSYVIRIQGETFDRTRRLTMLR